MTLKFGVLCSAVLFGLAGMTMAARGGSTSDDGPATTRGNLMAIIRSGRKPRADDPSHRSRRKKRKRSRKSDAHASVEPRKSATPEPDARTEADAEPAADAKPEADEGPDVDAKLYTDVKPMLAPPPLSLRPLTGYPQPAPGGPSGSVPSPFVAAKAIAEVKPVAPAPEPGKPEACKPVPCKPGPDLPEFSNTASCATTTTPVFTLVEAIHMAWDANPDFRAAAHHAVMSDEQLSRARADLFPSISANLDVARSDNALRKFSYVLSEGKTDPAVLFNAGENVDNYHAYLKLDYEVYTGGLRLSQIRAAEATRAANQHGLESTYNRIVFQVAEAYFRCFQAGQVVSVREEVVNLTEKQLEEARVREKSQITTHNEVLKMELKLSEAREHLVDAQTKEKLSRAVLENVIGLRLGRIKLPDTLGDAPWARHVDRIEKVAAQYAAVGGPDPKREVSFETDHRAELSEADDQLRAAQQRVLMARAGEAPRVGFTSSYDFYAGDFSQVPGSYFLGLVVSVNLFDAGRTKAEVRQAQIAASEILARNKRLRMDVELDIRRALLELNGAKEKQKVAEASVKSARENVTAVESEVANAFATQTELLEAKVAVIEAKVRVLTAATDVEVARASLERSTGCLAGLLAREMARR